MDDDVSYASDKFEPRERELFYIPRRCRNKRRRLHLRIELFTLLVPSFFVLGVIARSSYASTIKMPETYTQICAERAKINKLQFCTHVLKIGYPAAKRIIILEPGASLGAESLEPDGQYLSRMLARTQIWVVDRREQDLMDLSRLGSRNENAYYLKEKYLKVPVSALNRARSWGLAITVKDLRRIVLSAEDDEKREVFLGGHSWGATIALAYAAWSFHGVPGYRGLRGLILIDGGVHDSFSGEGYKFRLTERDVKERLKKLNRINPFSNDLGFLWHVHSKPETVPILYQLAATQAFAHPARISKLQELLPKTMRPNVKVDNKALLGWLIDTGAPVKDLKAHAGHLRSNDDSIYGWTSDGAASIKEIARVMSHRSPAAVEWYWPERLSLDLEAVDPFTSTSATKVLGLKISYASAINVPLYTFETGLTHGTVVKAAKWLVSHSKVTQAAYVTDASMAHLDPLFDAPDKNRFLSSVITFIRGCGN